MLSYQHGYHAGNFADVHKHAIYALVLDYLLAKPNPLACMDLYAGRGAYDLRDAMADKTGEAAQGILKLWTQPWPELLGKWRAVLEQVGGPNLRAYPGSPLLAAKLLRDGKLQVAEVASRCGFADSSYFIRVFREHFGKTPKNYR